MPMMTQFIDVTWLLDTMTEKRIAEAICERGDAKFAETIAQLHEIHFANLVVDSGRVHGLKITVCLLTNPHYPIQPVVFAFGENMNFSADDRVAAFAEPFSALDGHPIVVRSVIIDPLCSQPYQLFRVLD
jgi:hypothetical protein